MPKGSEEVYTKPEFKYLGRFRNKKFIGQGHNNTEDKCMACLDKCKSMPIIRKQTCEKNCLISKC